MTPSTAHGAPYADAATMRDAALACLDMLRGAAVLTKQNEDALIALLAAQQSEGVGPQGHRDGRMLGSLVETLSRVVEASLLQPTHAGTSRVESTGDGDGSATGEGRGKDDAAELDTKRPRVENAAEGGQQQHQEEEQQQQHLLPLTPHHVVPARAGQRPWGPAITVTTPTSVVLTSPELLLHVMGYVGGGRGALKSRRLELGQMALVCRAWRDAAQQEGLWEALAKELIPRLADARSARTTQAELEKAGGSYRRYVLEYGCVLRRRQVLGAFSWYHRLVLQFDVWHEISGQCLFSGEGMMRYPKALGNVVYLGMGAMILEGWGNPPFSAASRSDADQQYDNIHEYLESLRTLEVRVTVHDKMTGRKVVLWNEYDTGIAQVRALEDDDDEYLVTSVRQSLTTASFGPTSLEGRVCFGVVPKVDQIEHDGALPDDQKEYVVDFPALMLEADGDLEVGRFVWSALGY